MPLIYGVIDDNVCNLGDCSTSLDLKIFALKRRLIMRVVGPVAAGKSLKTPLLSLILTLTLTSLAFSDSVISAQSVFRFNPNPEFMYLRVGAIIPQ
jgi:hypothetical protein